MAPSPQESSVRVGHPDPGRRRPAHARRGARAWAWLCAGALLVAGGLCRATVGELSMQFVHLGTDEGLSQGSVNAILQDAQGFMWLATEAGLDRYDGYGFSHISRSPSPRGALPRNFVTGLAQDHSGTLWIGMNGGGLASRSDRTGVITPTVQIQGVPVMSPQDHVRCVYVDREDRVWIGTADSGVVVIDQGRRTAKHLRHDSRDNATLSDDSVRVFIEDQRGRVWVGTDSGLDRVEPATGEVNRHATRAAADIPSPLEGANVRALLEDSDGVLWVGTTQGLLRLDPRVRKTIAYRHADSEPASLPSDSVTALLEDESHRIWVGTSDGLALWNRLTDTFTTYRHEGAYPTSLPSNEIRTLYQDRGGVLWVGTEADGAARWNPRSWSFGHHQLVKLDGHGVSNISDFKEDRSGTLWIATLGDGLRAVDDKTGAVRVYRHDDKDPHSIHSDSINAIWCATDGIVWLGTRDGLSRLDPRTGRAENFVPQNSPDAPQLAPGVIQVLQDAQGHIWALVPGNGLARFDTQTSTFRIYRNDPSDPESLPNNHIQSMAEDRGGRIWVGADDGQLALLDPRTDHFYRFGQRQGDANTATTAPIDTIYVDDGGTVWLGTLGGGLIEVIGSASTPATIRFQAYGASEGLENSTVYGIESDSSGHIWVSTNRGLARFDHGTKRFRTFHHSHGLQGEEFNQGANFRRRDGLLLFGGPNGYNAFYPEKLEFNRHAPPLALTGYLKLNAPVDTPVPIERLTHAEVDYRDNVVSFEFSALDYSSPENNHFSYMLEGFDKTWVDAGNKRVVTYTNLAGGSYIFRVRAANGDGTWNATGIALPVTVSSAPWATRTAMVCYAVLLLLLLGVTRHIQNGKLRREAAYAKRLEMDVHTRTAELEHANRQLKEASVTDPMTGLGNRRYLSEALAGLEKSAAGGVPRMSLMVIDLDHLKPINDAYGHEAGDRIILQMADILRSCCRSSDYIVRWGGDEFVIAYLDADLDAATTLAEQIRSRISKQIFRLADGKAARSSCSIGFCCHPFVPQLPKLFTWQQTLAIADAALNQAKRHRNYWTGISSTASTTSLGSSFLEIISLDPTELERGGHVAVRRPTVSPDETGAHLRLIGRRNTD